MIRLWDTYERCVHYVRHDQILEVEKRGTHHGAKAVVRIAGKSESLYVGDEAEWIITQIAASEVQSNFADLAAAAEAVEDSK